jgi:hypothetical protein
MMNLIGKKTFLIFVGVLFLKFSLNAQVNHSNKNLIVLDSLRNNYISSCIKIYKNKIKHDQLKKDLHVINDLNYIYSLPLDSNFFTSIENLGFYKSSNVFDLEKNEIFLYSKNAGNIRPTVKIIVDNKTKKLERVIAIATESKFRCKTKESFSYCLIDFVYLRRVIKKSKIPLRISRYCSALETTE